MSRFQNYITWIKQHLPNKYWTVLMVFAVFILFFDGNSLYKRYKTRQQIASLEREIKEYDKRIANDQAEIKALEDNLENLERFAREYYFMKKQNEDIFIIKE